MHTTIFFTGGSGFVGGYAIPGLVKAGYTVLALARSDRSAAKVESLGATAVRDDLTALSDATLQALKECDAVIHSAAYFDFDYNKQAFYQINVEATRTLVQMAKKAGVKRFINIGAAAVVAETPAIQVDEDSYDPTQLPSELYPLTKALGEQIVLEADAPGFQTLSLSPPAIWGPKNPHFDDMLEMAKKGQFIWVGGGNHILSTIHVYNLTAAMVAALESQAHGKMYFVTDGEQREMRTFFTQMLNREGLDPGNRTLPVGIANFMAHLIGGIYKRLGLNTRPPLAPIMVRLMGREFSVRDTRARQELGYENAISIEEGLALIG